MGSTKRNDKDSPSSWGKPLDCERLRKTLEKSGGSVGGAFAPEVFGRLSASVAKASSDVAWTLSIRPGPENRPRAPRDFRVWLEVSAQVVLTCQRCLEPIEIEVSSRRGFEFVASAREADLQTEAALENLGLAGTPDDIDFISPEDGISLIELIEDELLLSLPPAAKHPDCRPVGLAGGSGQTVRPFADLKRLLKKG